MARSELEKRLRSEYSKTSRRIRQQLTRLQKAEPGNLYTSAIEKYPSLAELDRQAQENSDGQRDRIAVSDLQALIKRANKIYKSHYLTVPAYRKALRESVTTLRRNGYSFVTDANVEDVWKFINDMRDRGLATIYGYNYFVNMYNRIANDRTLTSAQLEQTIKDWTEYGQKYAEKEERYKQRAARARELGRPIPKAPRPKELKFTRTLPKKSSSRDY